MERMNNFERLTRVEGEAAVQALLIEGIVDRVSALEEMMLASKLLKLDDRGVLVMRNKKDSASPPSRPS